MAADKAFVFSVIGTRFRDQIWMNSWWKSWKSQIEVASSKSIRNYYGIPPDPKEPDWTQRQSSRLAVPADATLRRIKEHAKQQKKMAKTAAYKISKILQESMLSQDSDDREERKKAQAAGSSPL